MAARVLIVEDEPNLRELVQDVLKEAQIETTPVGTLAAAEAALAEARPDLLVLDIQLPDGDGLEWLQRQSENLRVPVVVITAYGTVDRAVNALRIGASDFLVKPFDNERLLQSITTALHTEERRTEAELEAGVVEAKTDLSKEIIGREGGLSDVVALLDRVAALDCTVLVQGESGTGKELVARALHDASLRRDGPFVSVNCAALPPSLLESELFGFERGAFTGAHAQKKGWVESADGGTLFLDEVGDMALEAQSRLLRVIQEREITRIGGRAPVSVDVRIISATHRDLEARVQSGDFRQDLLYRLSVVPIRLPPLRARTQDIRGLVTHFLSKHGARLKQTPPELTEPVLEKLVAHPWPGNVRELENTVERAVALGRFHLDALQPATADVPSAAAEPPAPEPPPMDDGPLPTLREAVARAERAAVVAALRRSGGNKAQAARLLGVSYKTLFNKIHEHDIKERFRVE